MKTLFEETMLKEAIISGDESQFRYLLVREWATYRQARSILFVMLNPSVADVSQDDPTIRKCICFAKCHEYGRIEVVNLYAFRATDPKVLKSAGYPVGPQNDSYILGAIERADKIVAAWGCHAQKSRADAVTKIICQRKNVYCLGVTKDGFPSHPLMVPYKQPFVYFEGSDCFP